MRALVLSALAVFAAQGQSKAGAPPDNFAEIKWGTSYADARAIFGRNPELQLNEKYSSGKQLVYEGGSFGGFTVYFWDLYFDQDRFVCGQVKYNEDIDRRFAVFRDALVKKYGAPTTRSGKRKAVRWKLPGNLGSHPIEIYLRTRGGELVLSYTDVTNTRAKADTDDL